MASRLPSLLTALAILLLSLAARAEAPLAPADRAAIRSVIERQIQAFGADDAAAAVAFAAPSIRRMFGDPDRFMALVRQGYQPVYRPREVEFRDLVERAGRPIQRVLLVGPDGLVVVASYTMERQPDGSWRVAGCILEGAEQHAA